MNTRRRKPHEERLSHTLTTKVKYRDKETFVDIASTDFEMDESELLRKIVLSFIKQRKARKIKQQEANKEQEIINKIKEI